MTPVEAINLVKIGVALMAAYLAVAGLLPKVLEKLIEVAGSVDGMVQRKEFEEKYKSSIQRASVFAALLPIGYIATGFGVVTLAAFSSLADVPCVSFSCAFVWLPVAANIALVVALTQLVVTTFIFLLPFSKAVSEILGKLRS